jgi:hypothetical protein
MLDGRCLARALPALRRNDSLLCTSFGVERHRWMLLAFSQPQLLILIVLGLSVLVLGRG